MLQTFKRATSTHHTLHAHPRRSRRTTSVLYYPSTTLLGLTLLRAITSHSSFRKSRPRTFASRLTRPKGKMSAAPPPPPLLRGCPCGRRFRTPVDTSTFCRMGKDASTHCFWVIMDKETKWAGKCEKIVTNFLKLAPGVGLRKGQKEIGGRGRDHAGDWRQRAHHGDLQVKRSEQGCGGEGCGDTRGT